MWRNRGNLITLWILWKYKAEWNPREYSSACFLLLNQLNIGSTKTSELDWIACSYVIPITLERILKGTKKAILLLPLSVMCVLYVHRIIHHSLFIFAQEHALAIKNNECSKRNTSGLFLLVFFYSHDTWIYHFNNHKIIRQCIWNFEREVKTK